MDVCRSLIVCVIFICLCYVCALLISDLSISVYKREGEIERRRQSCDPEVCGQQCFSNNYMNAWCENFTCYCDNDCLRHRILYPWDDEARTCAHLCNHKHGPCTGSGCANDTYWANSTWAEYGLHVNTSSWLQLPVNTNWRPQYYFFNSSVCFCYDNQTDVQDMTTTVSPTTEDWASDEYNSSSEWKFWLNFNPLKQSKESSSEEGYGLPGQSEERREDSKNSNSNSIGTKRYPKESGKSNSAGKESAEYSQSHSAGDKSWRLGSLAPHATEVLLPNSNQGYLKRLFRKQRKLQRKLKGKVSSRRNRYQIRWKKRMDSWTARKQQHLFGKMSKGKKQYRKHRKSKRKHITQSKKKSKVFNR